MPDFRNRGVVLRLVVVVNLLVLAAGLVRADDLGRFHADLLLLAMHVEPPLILSVAVLFLIEPLLVRLTYAWGVVAVTVLVALATALWQALVGVVDGSGFFRPLVWSQVLVGLALGYFHQRRAAYSPSLAEARLIALTARIRPHFLFNSLNGVLGVLRSNPRRAEEALEELSDLFRALMRDHRDLVPLADEIALCERYLSLERLRLGERLGLAWERDGDADAALVPPLFLQPLVENAVYHGIEPGAGPGTVSITIARRGPMVNIEIANPRLAASRQVPGNRMALDNIRERLMLFYDLEASLDIEQSDSVYRVRIRLPYRSTP